MKGIDSEEIASGYQFAINEMAKIYGGNIKIESGKDKGSGFIIKISKSINCSTAAVGNYGDIFFSKVVIVG